MNATASLAHRLDGVRRLASRGTDAAVVEGDDPVSFGDAIDHPRVPVVEVPRQVHEEDDGDSGLRAELAVGEIHTTSGDGAGWCVLVCSAHSHGLLLTSQLTTKLTLTLLHNDPDDGKGGPFTTLHFTRL